jgi:hypothetical protein
MDDKDIHDLIDKIQEKQKAGNSWVTAAILGALAYFFLGGWYAPASAPALSPFGNELPVTNETVRWVLSLVAAFLPYLYQRFPMLKDFFQKVAPDGTKGEILEKLAEISQKLDAMPRNARIPKDAIGTYIEGLQLGAMMKEAALQDYLPQPSPIGEDGKLEVRE